MKASDYEVVTLSYGDVKPLIAARTAAKDGEGDAPPDNFQEQLAGLAIRKDGQPIGAEALNALPFPVAQKLMIRVAELNSLEQDEARPND